MPTAIVMPKLGLTMTEGVLTKWLVEDGQEVRKGQHLFEIETDKVTLEAEAEADGVIWIQTKAGETVPVLATVGYLTTPGERAPALAASTEGTPAPARRPISPAAKRRAAEAGVDINEVPAGGADGRVSVADVEAYLAARMQSSPAPAAETATQINETPLSGIRGLIAERMLAASQQTAAVTLTTEVDAGELVLVRERLNQSPGQQLGFRISYNDLLAKLVAECLHEFPYMNARLENKSIRTMPEIAIGLAVDTARGLIVVAGRDTRRKSLVAVAREYHEKIERALSGRSVPEDLDGATFTITNLGGLGVDVFTPIINLPQAAILGVGRIRQVPAVWQGRIEPRHRVVLSLTFDHRLTDGAPAGRFLQRLGQRIEEASLLLVDCGVREAQ
jgi:pyruvate dehydrogenase E2 component (dihydrolipoamide acetyltransferase)